MEPENKNYMHIATVMRRAQVSRTTAISWCKKYNIGIKIGGRWRVDPDKFEELMKGTPYEELQDEQ